MSTQFLKEGFGWGFVLWLIGYVLGIVLFAVVPLAAIGWIITPIGIAITLWVLLTRIKASSLQYYFVIGLVWTLIAVAGDYIFIVLLFKASGYYKSDVYLYYVLTFALPPIVGWWKNART